MLISSCSTSLGFSAFLKEPEVNREASNYIINNYPTLIGIIKKLEIKDEKAQDLLHDVFISIVQSENNGEGFDMEFGTHVASDGTLEVNLMDVSQFVIGRIRLYAKNAKYRTDIVEGIIGSVTQTNVYYDSELDENGQEVLTKEGKVKLKKRVEKQKVAVMMSSSAASFTDGGDIEENNDEFQKAFAIASVSDSAEDIAEIMSIKEQIDYCIDVCSLHDVNLLNIFRNIDALADMLGTYSKKKKSAESVFSKITELIEYHSELADNLMDVFKFSARNRAVFDEIIATYA